MSEPLVIATQGSFFVAGREVTARGVFDPTASASPDGAGQTHWVDPMYVQYQIPVNARRVPLVLVHGGGGTGAVWESTPDGREGYQTLFLRRGFPVYIVDSPRGGRSGFPSYEGEFGMLDDGARHVGSRTKRPGREQMWSRWRLGPEYPQVFERQAFPMESAMRFLRHVRPMVSDSAEVICEALMVLLERIGPAVLVTHSNSGLPGWLCASRSSKVLGVVSYEPGFVFPTTRVPTPIPLYKGEMQAGVPIDVPAFCRLASVPLQVVYGDNIPCEPIANLLADGRRAQVIACRHFVDACNEADGRASLLHLPAVGLFGNSHFMFSDLNNVQVADQLSAFLALHNLDS